MTTLCYSPGALRSSFFQRYSTTTGRGEHTAPGALPLPGGVEAVARVIDEDFAESMRLLGQYLATIEKQPAFMPAYRARDFVVAKETGRQALMFQLEPQTFARELENIELAYGLGIRMAMLTFNTRNYVGDGCGERTDEGLSYWGLQVVERMNELGMLIDLSHCGNRTTLDAIEASKAPVLCNHTGARALYPQCKRLKTDEVLTALAAKGGLVGISAVPNQLSGSAEQGIEDMLNHIDYVVRLVGVDHVAIGLDNIFGDQVGHHREMAASKSVDFRRSTMHLAANFMYGIESPLEWKNIIRGLVSRGYSDEEIAKIVGENALRVIEEVAG